MLDVCTSAFVCPANRCAFTQWFENLKVVMSHPELSDDEKHLWIWLATHSANKTHHSCSCNYEQISQAVHKPFKALHRALFRLKITGLLNADLPIWYGEPTREMIKQIRVFRPMFISEEALRRQQIIIKERQEALQVKQRYDGQPVLINLLKKV